MSAAPSRSSAKPWHDEYSRKLSQATSFEGRKAFLLFCRSKLVGNPTDIAEVGAALLEQAGGPSAATSSLGYEHDDVQEQTATAELLCGRIEKAEGRIAQLNAAHNNSARATRLKGLLAEAKGETRAAKVHYDEVLSGGLNPVHAPTLKRKVALAKGKLNGVASTATAPANGNFPLSLLHDGISDEDARDAAKELSSYLSLYSGDADAWIEMAELQCSLQRPQQASFCYDECLLLAPNHPEYHTRAAELALYRALKAMPASVTVPSSASSSSSSAAPALSADGLKSAVSHLSAQADLSMAALASTVASSTTSSPESNSASSVSVSALLTTARLHASEAVRLSERTNPYPLMVLADVCWAHVSHVCNAIATAAGVISRNTSSGAMTVAASMMAADVVPSSSLLLGPFPACGGQLFSVSTTNNEGPSLASIVKRAGQTLASLPSATAAVSSAAIDAAVTEGQKLSPLLKAAASADPQVVQSALLHRLACHHLQQLRDEAAAGKGLYKGLLSSSSISSTSGVDAALPFTVVLRAALTGPYAGSVVARDSLLTSAGIPGL